MKGNLVPKPGLGRFQLNRVLVSRTEGHRRRNWKGSTDFSCTFPRARFAGVKGKGAGIRDPQSL